MTRTRRSISVAGKTYARIELAKKLGKLATPDESYSGYIERLIATDLDAQGVPMVDKAPSREPKKPTATAHPGSHFTF